MALFENAKGILKRLGVSEMKVVFPDTAARANRNASTAADTEAVPPA